MIRNRKWRQSRLNKNKYKKEEKDLQNKSGAEEESFAPLLFCEVLAFGEYIFYTLAMRLIPHYKEKQDDNK